MNQGAGVSKGSSGLGGKRNPTTNVKILGSFALEYQLGLNTLRLGGKFSLEVNYITGLLIHQELARLSGFKCCVNSNVIDLDAARGGPIYVPSPFTFTMRESRIPIRKHIYSRTCMKCRIC